MIIFRIIYTSLFPSLTLFLKNFYKIKFLRAGLILFGLLFLVSITHAYVHTHDDGRLYDNCPILAYADMVQVEPSVLLAPIVIFSLIISDEILKTINNPVVNTHTDIRLPEPNAPPVISFQNAA